MLLETLYDHIIDKSKLLTGKKVERIRHLEDIVEITTTDGSKYTGDIVVGTDGVHSRVRQEMVQYAKELGVAEDYTDDERTFRTLNQASPYVVLQCTHKLQVISATYACLFGLSTSTPTLPRGLLGWNLGHDYSYITGTGPEDRTYWGLMIKLDRTYYGKEIPVLTEEDKERIIRKHWDDPITAEIHLSDLYKRSIHILASPLREIVLKKWFCGRMVVLGDAAHKVRQT
jgi:2-polyprenyl-6-methoxyphenol hydroxylase-like FAD-dependent oxidoreductase